MISTVASHRPRARTLGAAVAAITVALAVAASPVSAKQSSQGKAVTASVEDYSQCTNGSPGTVESGCVQWINGILQSSNSHYAENEVTPQRLLIKYPKGTALSARTIRLRYQARKAETHAYDSLATWNTTQTTAARCQDLANCPGGDEDAHAIPDDPTEVPPATNGTAVTAEHDLDGQFIHMYGGDITDVSVPVHDNASGDGDDYAAISVTFDVPADASADRYIQLLFGGHIALGDGPTGWGTGLGAGNISGGPYHIKLTAVDGSSVGNRDNQIMGAAILPPPGAPNVTVVKTADDATVSAGETIGYTITVTNEGAQTATGVDLTDNLPAGSSLDWSIAGGTGAGFCQITGAVGSEVLECDFGDLDPGEGYTVQVTSPTSEADCGSVMNQATATPDNQLDPVSSEIATITVECPTLTTAKTADDNTVSAGEDIGFTIRLTNDGPGTAFGATIDDDLPGVTGMDWEIDGGVSQALCSITGVVGSEHLHCDLGDLEPAEFGEVHVSSPTTEDSVGTHQNTATGDASNAPPDDDDDAVTVLGANPDTVKIADDDEVSVGEPIGFTITYSNGLGGGTIINATINDPLPGAPGMDWEIDGGANAADCTITGSVGAEVLECSFGDLDPGESREVHVSSPTTQETPPGDYENIATGDGDNVPPDEGRDIITVLAPSPSFVKQVDASPVNVGDPIGFTMTASNAGPGVWLDVTLNDPLPGATGMDWEIDGGLNALDCQITGTVGSEVLTCDFGDLDPGESAEVHVSSPTTTATEPGSYENVATADGSNTDPLEGRDTVVIVGPTLVVGKTSCPESVVPGGLLTYTITYANDGPGDAHNATLVDTIPGDTTVTDAGGGDVSGDGSTITWDLDTLEDGESGTKTFVVQVNAPDGSTLTNRVELTADEGSAEAFEMTTAVTLVGAATSGNSYAVDVDLLNVPVLNEVNKKSTQADPAITPTDASGTLVSLPANPVIAAGIITNASHSEVNGGSSSRATATIADVSLLGGALTAQAVHGVSESEADAQGATYGSTGSHFVDLRVNGDQVVSVAPGDHALLNNPLDPDQVIAEATLYEETGASGLTGATWSASHSVNMIHVTLLQPFGTLPEGAEIIVAHADTTATYPSGLACGDQPDSVSGKAFTLFAQGTLGGDDIATGEVGLVEIPTTGGSNSDHTENVVVPEILATTTTDHSSCGSLDDATECGAPAGTAAPYATSRAIAQGVNLLDGVVTADVLDVTSTSYADGTSADTTFTAVFGNLTVGGESVNADVSPNSTYTITSTTGETIVVILNEQIESTNAPTDSEGTINAVHVLVLSDTLDVTAEVIAASAHSGAHSS